MAENNKNVEQRENALERFGLWLAAWSEKWFPDAWVFALVGIVFVFIFGLLIGESPQKLVWEGGKSFWILIPFTMQMAFVVIGGYVVAWVGYHFGLWWAGFYAPQKRPRKGSRKRMPSSSLN